MEFILSTYRRNEGWYLPSFNILEDAVRDRLVSIRKGMEYLMDGADSSWDVHPNKKKPASYNIGSLCTWKNIAWKEKTYAIVASHVENYRSRHNSMEGEITVYFLLQDNNGDLFYGETAAKKYIRNQFLQVSGLELKGVWTLADFYREAQIGCTIRRCAIKDFLQGLCRLSAYGVKGEDYGADSFFAKVAARMSAPLVSQENDGVMQIAF